MTRLTSEYKVGCFTLVVLAIIAFGYAYFIDGVRADEAFYRVSLRLPNAEGLYTGTPVKLAGVEVGDIETVELDGKHIQPLPDGRQIVTWEKRNPKRAEIYTIRWEW